MQETSWEAAGHSSVWEVAATKKTPLQESDDCGFWILASLWCHLVSAFAWQAWHNVHWQGLGCTPWRPSGVPLVPFGLCRSCVAGVAQRALPRGRMYALASLWRPSGAIWSPPLVPLSFRRFCVAGVAQRALVMCIAKGSDGVPLASLWRPSGVAGVAQRALARGRIYALASLWRLTGVIWSPPFCVAGVAQRALPRGRMYGLASVWRLSGAIWSPPL